MQQATMLFLCMYSYVIIFTHTHRVHCDMKMLQIFDVKLSGLHVRVNRKA